MRFLGSMFDTDKTFRPRKKYKEGTELHRLHEMSLQVDPRATTDVLSKMVLLPPGANLHDWLSVSTTEFYNIINACYGPLTEFCTSTTCPVMLCGPVHECYWRDPPAYPKATRLSAPEYIVCLMDWIDAQITDERLFPSESYNPYPADFMERVRAIFKRMMRVFGHIYSFHLQDMTRIGHVQHVNTAMKHFAFFVWHYNLVPREEMAPLREVLINLLGQLARDKLDYPN